jgi:hypothetical protein
MTTYNSKGYDAKANNPVYRTGKSMRVVPAELAIDVSEATDGDIYVLAGGLTTNARIHRIQAPAGIVQFAAAADNDLGFYYKKEGVLTAVDADALVDGFDLTAAATANIDLLSLNSSLDRTKTIGELLSLAADNTYADGLFLCLTINTKETTADKEIDLDIVIEQPTAN